MQAGIDGLYCLFFCRFDKQTACAGYSLKSRSIAGCGGAELGAVLAEVQVIKLKIT